MRKITAILCDKEKPSSEILNEEYPVALRKAGFLPFIINKEESDEIIRKTIASISSLVILDSSNWQYKYIKEAIKEKKPILALKDGFFSICSYFGSSIKNESTQFKCIEIKNDSMLYEATKETNILTDLKAEKSVKKLSEELYVSAIDKSQNIFAVENRKQKIIAMQSPLSASIFSYFNLLCGE